MLYSRSRVSRVRPSDEKRISFWTTELWKSWVASSRVLGLVKGTSHPLLDAHLLVSIHELLLVFSPVLRLPDAKLIPRLDESAFQDLLCSRG